MIGKGTSKNLHIFRFIFYDNQALEKCECIDSDILFFFFSITIIMTVQITDGLSNNLPANYL